MSSGRGQSQDFRGQQGRGQQRPGPKFDWPTDGQPPDPLSTFPQNTDILRRGLIANQGGQKLERTRQRVAASDALRQMQGHESQAQREARMRQGSSTAFRPVSAHNPRNDPGSPDPRDQGTDAYDEQMKDHLEALRAKDEADNRMFTDFASRKPGRCEADDFSVEEAETIREITNQRRLADEKGRELEKAWRIQGRPKSRENSPNGL